MLITHSYTNLHTERERERERERDSKELQKVYILSLHTLDSKFTNDMVFWTFSFTLVLFCTSQT